MNKEEQLNSDKKVLASLEAEYKRAQRVIYSIRALVTDLNFEELIPDSQERCLMVDELQAYDYIRTNLMNRIRFYRNRIKRDENAKDWSQYKKTDSAYIGVDVSDEGDHGACCQVCGDTIATHHCGQDECNRSGLMTLKEMVNDYVERCDENGRLKIDLHRCGQDAVNEEQLTDGMAERLTNGYKNYCRAALEAYLERKITWWQLKEKMLMPDLVEWVKACGQDATCPVGGGNAAVITGDSLKDLLGMEVISVGDMPCDACNPDNYAGRPCVKVELVGGTYLCLAPQPNSIITE